MDSIGWDDLVGTWVIERLAFHMSDNGETITFPVKCVGIFSPNGRWTVVGLPSDSAEPETDVARAELYRKMVAFSARCHLKDNIIHAEADVVWHPAMVGRTMIRPIEFRGGRLIVRQPEWDHPFFPGRKASATVTWVREQP